MNNEVQNRNEVRDLLLQIARALVDHPQAVALEERKTSIATTFQLRAAPEDVGKLIGKQGRTARSMRTILGAVSVKYQHRYTLEIIDNGQLANVNPYTRAVPNSTLCDSPVAR